jgi:hypothetical protein
MQCGLQGSDRYDPEPSGHTGVVRAIDASRKRPRLFSGLPSRNRGQSLVEFALVLPILLFVLVAIADFGRIFATGVELEAATRDGAETGANEYISKPPPGDGTAPLNAPAPTPGSAAYYDALHLKVAKVVCTEMRDQPNSDYAAGTCPTMPVVLVCVHDAADPSCATPPFGGAVPGECGDLATLPPSNDQATGSPERWVEVRTCYHFTSFLGIPVPPLGDYWLQRTRTFVIPCYFVLGSGDCG